MTPAIQRGCAPKSEKTPAAMKDERRTSATPYCCVVSIKSSENAMPGKMLQFGGLIAFAVAGKTPYFEKNVKAVAGTTR